MGIFDFNQWQKAQNKTNNIVQPQIDNKTVAKNVWDAQLKKNQVENPIVPLPVSKITPDSVNGANATPLPVSPWEPDKKGDVMPLGGVNAGDVNKPWMPSVIPPPNTITTPPLIAPDAGHTPPSPFKINPGDVKRFTPPPKPSPYDYPKSENDTPIVPPPDTNIWGKSKTPKPTATPNTPSETATKPLSPPDKPTPSPSTPPSTPQLTPAEIEEQRKKGLLPDDNGINRTVRPQRIWGARDMGMKPSDIPGRPGEIPGTVIPGKKVPDLPPPYIYYGNRKDNPDNLKGIDPGQISITGGKDAQGNEIPGQTYRPPTSFPFGSGGGTMSVLTSEATNALLGTNFSNARALDDAKFELEMARRQKYYDMARATYKQNGNYPLNAQQKLDLKNSIWGSDPTDMFSPGELASGGGGGITLPSTKNPFAMLAGLAAGVGTLANERNQASTAAQYAKQQAESVYKMGELGIKADEAATKKGHLTVEQEKARRAQGAAWGTYDPVTGQPIYKTPPPEQRSHLAEIIKGLGILAENAPDDATKKKYLEQLAKLVTPQPNEGDRQPLQTGGYAVYKNGQWVKE
ncbi:MAG: hypothetical protein HQL01_12865 [Nitrospirae bacterium]|nr:hypothetical protein [Nitrospirota bacterium]